MIKRMNTVWEGQESYTKASCGRLANDEGNAPERLLLLILLLNLNQDKKAKPISWSVSNTWGRTHCDLCFWMIHMYWRSVRLPREAGISPEKWLLDKSMVWSLERLPISAGKGPVMLLFWRNLHEQSFNRGIHKDEKTKFFFIEIARLLALSTHKISRFVKFPMLGSSVPVRFWLGVALQERLTDQS